MWGFPYQLQLSLPFSRLWSGLYLDRRPKRYGPHRLVSTRSPKGFARYCHFKGFTEFDEFSESAFALTRQKNLPMVYPHVVSFVLWPLTYVRFSSLN